MNETNGATLLPGGHLPGSPKACNLQDQDGEPASRHGDGTEPCHGDGGRATGLPGVHGTRAWSSAGRNSAIRATKAFSAATCSFRAGPTRSSAARAPARWPARTPGEARWRRPAGATAERDRRRRHHQHHRHRSRRAASPKRLQHPVHRFAQRVGPGTQRGYALHPLQGESDSFQLRLDRLSLLNCHPQRCRQLAVALAQHLQLGQLSVGHCDEVVQHDRERPLHHRRLPSSSSGATVNPGHIFARQRRRSAAPAAKPAEAAPKAALPRCRSGPPADRTTAPRAASPIARASAPLPEARPASARLRRRRRAPPASRRPCVPAGIMYDTRAP